MLKQGSNRVSGMGSVKKINALLRLQVLQDVSRAKVVHRGIIVNIDQVMRGVDALPTCPEQGEQRNEAEDEVDDKVSENAG